jgi:putative SOS response-associated peptidase YedK
MCARYIYLPILQYLKKMRELQDYEINKDQFNYENWNVAPRQQIVAIANRQSPGLDQFTFGITPAFNEKLLLFNAREDKILSGKGYWQRFKNNRCLIFASGFYEWSGPKTNRQPYFFNVAEQEVFAFAGLWHSVEVDGQERKMATIITTTPNEMLEPLHDRMPVILARNAWMDWIQEEKMELPEIGDILKPFPAEQMSFHPVAKDVGNVANNRPELIEAIEL